MQKLQITKYAYDTRQEKTTKSLSRRILGNLHLLIMHWGYSYADSHAEVQRLGAAQRKPTAATNCPESRRN